MNRYFHNIIAETVKRRFKKNRDVKRRRLSEEVKILEVSISHIIHDVFFIVIGVISAGFGLKGFLLPNSFIDGGAMGISLLISEVTAYSLSLLIVIVNFPFIILGYSNLGKQFAFKSILAIVGLALTVHFIPYPVVTSDKLLIAVFGGFFLGGGIGLSIRGGAVIDGTEVLAIYLSKKTGLTIGDIILLFNIIIFSFGAYILSVEVALYAMLTYMAAAKTVDFIIEGVEEYTGITIISVKSEMIRSMITEKLRRGVTVYKGKGGFEKSDMSLTEYDIIYTIVTRLEIANLKTEIDKIDENAFIIMNSIKDTKGGMIKKRPLK
ncbi:YitT family protein [Lutibacter sp. HS1-25]|uniref:YitT family protein n=1 Tax=Lutibacter sp. HS1-25 TaxID=2485000 RepID=UPI001012EC36|nr:YitT family protein [Lutibacter sp. HS1-25]RXP55498.1 YitT family protein [Lutibacter sp. HS1-25]